jgi:hypothetical protein
MPSLLNIRHVCSRRPKAGQLEDPVRVLALLGYAVGNFCRRHRDFRENRVANINVILTRFSRSPNASRRSFNILVAGFGAAFLGARLTTAN